MGLNETMNDSLAICQEHFADFWGQTLVNTMRALHEIKYNQPEDENEDTDDECECGNHDCDCGHDHNHGHHHG